MAGPSIMDTLFQRTLEDLIKGIRLQLIGESAFISKAMEEIRKEIKSTDLHTKAAALQKLSYLNSLHFIDMSWAAFHCIECMSSPRFAQKRIGYVAISQSFHEHTPVLLLITNQIRKDLTSVNEFEVGLALDCLANIGTTDLARDLTPEIFTLLGSTKVFVKKKAIAVALRVFEKYPDAVRVCFKRLVENLDSPDSRILSAVVGVFCELAARDPRSYLPLAPEFYRILVDSKNNWVLIKVLKIFAKLAPLEPRLAKRVVDPICEHMRRTGAKSLLFECIRTIVSSLSEYESAVKLAVAKIREFLVDDDPNLKYLGLHALSVVAPKHLWVVLENKEIVIKSLSDADANIKFESLRLVMAVMSESNVVEISKVLLNYALKSDPEFCNEILGSILSICSANVYEIIIDFDWYVSLLGEMSLIPHCQKGEEIENQFIDIGMRVKDVRPELVRVGRSLLIDPALLGNPFLHRILSAAAWASGEYIEFSKNPFELMEALLQPRTSLLPPSIRAVYLQSVLKVLIFCVHSFLLQRENADSFSCTTTNDLEGVSEQVSKREEQQGDSFNLRSLDQSYEDLPLENNNDAVDSHGQKSKFASFEKNGFSQESILSLLNVVELALRPLLGSHEVELLERARSVLGLIGLIKQEIPGELIQGDGGSQREESEISKVIKLMNDALCEELGPVSLTAQERVQLPDGLILAENLNDLDPICGDIKYPVTDFFSIGSNYGERMDDLSFDQQSKEDPQPSNESTSLLAEHRKRHGLYYLPHEKNRNASNEYPLANDPKSVDNGQDNEAEADVDDFVKLTAQSLAPKKKTSHSKPRPVVVKLDDGEVISSVAPKILGLEHDFNLLSGAVQDVLKENDLSMRKGKDKLDYDDLPLGSKENLQRKSKHRSHRKEKEENPEKARHKSSQRHGRKKTKQREEGGSVNAVAQSPVIPDFLL